ncbi:MAG: hypothetical protein JXA57_20595, partial [Armatimonadetes bacterium]|nr:hypothetical protein [Armatimonadota bacterium]
MSTSLGARHRSPERGSVLLLSIVILTVIFALGASLIERAQNTVYRASAENRSTQAFELAEAGVQKAVWALSQPNGWLIYDGEQGTALPGGFVNITVTPPASARDGIQPVTIVSSGWIPAPANHPENAQTIRVLSYWEPDTFDFAIFGDQFVEVGNGDVDVWSAGDVSEVGTNGTVSDAVAVAPEGVVNGNVVVGFGATAADLCIDNKGVISG